MIPQCLVDSLLDANGDLLDASAQRRRTFNEHGHGYAVKFTFCNSELAGRHGINAQSWGSIASAASCGRISSSDSCICKPLE